MALSPERYAVVDTELQQVQAYLVALTNELGETASADPSCQPCQAVLRVRKEIAHLRYLLTVAEARRQVSEQPTAPVSCADRAMPTSAAAAGTTPVMSALPALKWLTILLELPLRRH